MIRHPVRTECWGFAIGSAAFAVGSAPGFAGAAGSTASNIAFFGGSWFFTAAALLQFRLSGHLGAASAITGSLKVGREVHVSEWLSGLIQFFGTIAFNISTGAALIVHSIVDQDRYSWRPDVYGSIAFLVSSALAVFATDLYRRRDEPDAPAWPATVLNTVGSVAFGFSAAGAYVDSAGSPIAPLLDQGGTFTGALCFLAASLLSLPRKKAPAGQAVAG